MRTKVLALLLLIGACLTANAQVNYKKDGFPWNKKVNRGPDAEVPGWYYNLGITGIRAELVPDKPKYLLVKYVFKKSPAYGKVKEGDYIIAAGGKNFKKEHINGYGMDKFGANGPMSDFAKGLEGSQDKFGRGIMKLTVLRGKTKIPVELKVGTGYGAFSTNFPKQCRKSEKITKQLLEYIADNQKPDGSWGSPIENLFAPLALMASDQSKYMKFVKKNIAFQAKTTGTEDKSWLVNWKYMTAAIVLSEYYLKKKDSKTLRELQEVYQFLIKTQYTDMSQIDPKTAKDPNRRPPTDNKRAIGGWGHNPGYEGYGPIAMVTAQGALAFSLMQRCGIKVDRKRHEMAYDYLERVTGKNGYTWYSESFIGGDNNWADMGRTGASGLAHWLSPYKESKFKKMALKQAKCIGKHPQSFPDTHGSPLLGMGYTALAANANPASLRKLLDNNRWWFALAQCKDGSFYYQPNRDNAGYGENSRVAASAVTALIFLMHKKTLVITGK